MAKTFKEWMITQGAWDRYLNNIEIPLDRIKNTTIKLYICSAFNWSKTN